MNNYVTLDGKRYMAPHGGFSPTRNKPVTERITLSGASDVTFGPGTVREWIGLLIAPVTPIDSNWGDVDDLRATLDKREALGFVDHYDRSTTIYAIGPHNEASQSPMWDAPTNEIRIQVRLVEDVAGGALVLCDTLGLSSEAPDASPAGGTVSVGMDTLSLAVSAGSSFPSRPVQLKTIELASEAHIDGIAQTVGMNTLSISSSSDLAVDTEVDVEMSTLPVTGSAETMTVV